jgi:cell division protein FtsW
MMKLSVGKFDWIMFAVAVALALFGVMMVYSASAMFSLKETDSASQFSYFFKQLSFTVAGLIAMVGLSFIDYRSLNNVWIVSALLLVTTLLLVAVFWFPEINGAKRWIRFGGFSFQPSELAKIVLAVALAFWLVKRQTELGSITRGVLPSVLILGLLGGLVLLEKDLGTTIVLCAIFCAVYFAAGARLLHIAGLVLILGVIGVVAILWAPWRIARMMAFLDPHEYASKEGYQVVQSLYALGSGGVLGEGFAKGYQKLFYLPYPYSDFIFSVVGEEFGLVGTMGVVLAFGVLLWRGARAAVLAPDRFGMLLSIGIITGIIVQALFNISVVTSILPAKGIPLPFISYGGSSVIVTLMGVGLLLSVARQAGTREIARDVRLGGRRRGKRHA